MIILVVNCGSSSLKYTLFDGEQERAAGLIEKIGQPGSSYTCRVGEQRRSIPVDAVPDHTQAITLMMRQLREDRVIGGARDIDAVGHRVVHGGPTYTDAARVDAKVRNNRIAKDLAPLHQPNYVGIEACFKLMPKTPQVAVFDTAFHQTMPPKAYTYALPYRFFRTAHIRRYGFHGTSHKYVSQRAAQLLRPRRPLRLITLHLGNGSSIAAVKNGRCLDTSMGLTPLAGVVMGSRCGDIDPAIVTYIMQREGLTPAQMEKLMNRESGVLGISGISNDLREVIARAKAGHARSRLALDVFAYSIQKYIGAYWAILGGADALVFTAGIGERSPFLRALICRDLAGIGVRLEAAKNAKVISQEGAISARGSAVQVWVIPTREEAMIARETARIIRPGARRCI
jgi:acetate kinase